MTELCIDFGGSAIKLGVCDDGRVLARSELPVQGTPADLDRAAAELRRLADTLPVTQAPVGGAASAAPSHDAREAGAGGADGGVALRDARAAGGDAVGGARAWGGASVVAIGVPGVVDRRRSALVAAHDKYGYLAGRDLDAWARETFGLPAVVENDARAALLGEARYGVARGAQNAVIAVFGTGIGTAALLDGRLLHGSHDHAGILGGHVTVDLDGPVCNCGNVGCAEAIASTWALDRSLAAIERRGAATEPDTADNSKRNGELGAIAAAQHDDWRTPRDRTGRGDGTGASTGGATLRARIDAGHAVGIADIVETLEHPDSRALLDLYLRAWSAAIVGLCHAYDPDVVIVSGGVMRSAQLILPALTEQVHAHLWSSSFRPPLVVPEHPDSSVVLGLSALAHPTDDAATERPRTR